MNIYFFGESPQVVRFAICVKCKKIQEFDAPGDWRPECCPEAGTATAVDLFKTLGKIPKGPLPPALQPVKDNLLELLSLVTDASDQDTKKNSENPA